MSGIWLLMVGGLWAGLSWGMWKGWRRWRVVEGANRRVRDAVALVAGAVWIGASFWYGGGQKVYYDMQVNRLCAKDGGIKVYETVKLPAEKFDKWGMVIFYDPSKKEQALGPEYQFKEDGHYFRRGDPEMWSVHNQIIRRSDGKLLSEAKIYIRRGGDLPGPWHDSSFSCPKEIGLIEKTFIRSNKE